MLELDLNCDLGEGAPGEAELMPLVTSANIACGGHAGDAATMRASVRAALRHGVAIGAHPGFVDREHFGRREWPLSAADVCELVVTQTRALAMIAREEGAELHHVKPHGALYNQAARDPALAGAVLEAVARCAGPLLLFAPAGSVLQALGAKRGFRVVAEIFADRTYQPDGSLTPRTQAGAVLADETEAIAQVLRFVREGKVRALDGTDLALSAETVCVHGDSPGALSLVRSLRKAMAAAGIRLQAPGL